MILGFRYVAKQLEFITKGGENKLSHLIRDFLKECAPGNFEYDSFRVCVPREAEKSIGIPY